MKEEGQQRFEDFEGEHEEGQRPEDLEGEQEYEYSDEETEGTEAYKAKQTKQGLGAMFKGTGAMMIIGGIIVLVLIYKLYGLFATPSAPKTQTTNFAGQFKPIKGAQPFQPQDASQISDISNAKMPNSGQQAGAASTQIAQPDLAKLLDGQKKATATTEQEKPVEIKPLDNAQMPTEQKTTSAEKPSAITVSPVKAGEVTKTEPFSASEQESLQATVPGAASEKPAAATVVPSTGTVPAAAATVEPSTVNVPTTAVPSEGTIATQQQVSAIEAQLTQNKAQMDKLTQSIQTLTNTLSGLNSSIADLSNTVEKVQSQQAPSVRGQTPPAQAPVVKKPVAKVGSTPEVSAPKLLKPAVSFYYVRAVIPGRAWIAGEDGSTFTVQVGDEIPGRGRVAEIDADKGIVRMEKGQPIKFGTDQ